MGERNTNTVDRLIKKTRNEKLQAFLLSQKQQHIRTDILSIYNSSCCCCEHFAKEVPKELLMFSGRLYTVCQRSNGGSALGRKVKRQ